MKAFCPSILLQTNTQTWIQYIDMYQVEKTQTESKCKSSFKINWLSYETKYSTVVSKCHTLEFLKTVFHKFT